MDNLLLGLSVAFQAHNIFYSFVGVSVGMLVGVLPGIGPMAAISILLPITYYMDPTSAILMLAGIYYGSAYGGSVASILLNIPGTASAVVTCLEGYPMAKSGRAGVALFMTAISSWVGGMIGLFCLVLSAGLIAQFALKFGPAEYFAIMVLGLVAASTISVGSPIKGLAMVLVGALLGTVGTDTNSGVPRFYFGVFHLLDGINIVVLAMGLFGVAEVINSFRGGNHRTQTHKVSLQTMMPTLRELRESVAPTLRGSAIGSVFGALPGTGGSIASFVSYAIEKRLGGANKNFGSGAIEGLVSPEASNNAAVQTAFVPTLSLGIPGDAVMALMMGALIMHGITPGPSLVGDHPELFWGLIASFAVGNILLLILNIPLIGVWVRILNLPRVVLYPTVVILICIGVYSLNSSYIDLLMTLFFGIVGYVMMVYKYDAAPLLLGFILSPLIEENLRRALLMSGGDASIFVGSPVAAVLVTASSLLLAWTLFSAVRKHRGRVSQA